MTLVKYQNHVVILMKCSLFIDEIKIHECFCPFHHTKCHFFDVFRIKYIMFDDVSIPWVGLQDSQYPCSTVDERWCSPELRWISMFVDVHRICSVQSCDIPSRMIRIFPSTQQSSPVTIDLSNRWITYDDIRSPCSDFSPSLTVLLRRE